MFGNGCIFKVNYPRKIFCDLGSTSDFLKVKNIYLKLRCVIGYRYYVAAFVKASVVVVNESPLWNP